MKRIMYWGKELKADVDRELRLLKERPVSGDYWIALGNRFKAKFERGEIQAAGIAATVRDERKLDSRDPILESRPRARGAAEPSRIARGEVLSDLAAYDAGTLDFVIDFRARHLSAGLLSLSDAAAWIEARYEQERTVRGVARTSPIQYVGTGDSRFFSSRPVIRNGLLDELRFLSEMLANKYHWYEGHATAFVLTGLTPPIARVRYGTITKVIPCFSRITLDLDPTVSPRELANIFRGLRAKLLGTRPHALGAKMLRLALFYIKGDQEKTNRQLMVEWNASYPKWSYDKPSLFSRDARKAEARLRFTWPVTLADSLASSEGKPRQKQVKRAKRKPR